MKQVLFAAAMCAVSSGAMAADVCRFDDAKVQTFVQEAVADFCDVSGEAGGIDGMVYDTKAPCIVATPIHLEGAGKLVVVSFGNKTKIASMPCPTASK